MKVQDIMTAAPLTCGPQTNLAQVVHEMWQGDCGIIPVIDEARRVLGVITDRDICIAAATRDQPPSYIRAADLVKHPAVCCRVGDDVRTALRTMKEHRVRRLPVVGADDTIQGMISMNDIVLEVKGTSAPTAADVVDALKSVCAHTHASVAPVPQKRPAARKSRISRSSGAGASP
jgi:CBS domain-containing protein